MLSELPYKVMDRSAAGAIPRITIIALIVFVLSFGHSGTHSARAGTGFDSEALVSRMEGAYRCIEDYQARLVITCYGDDRFSGVKKLTYTFKKPNRIRVDFDSPHHGMSVAYPNREGKVVVRLSKLLPSSLNMHIDPRSPLLEIAPGQHLNQTDIGLLIRNIDHSLTDMLLGDPDVFEGTNTVIIRTLADNPFNRGTPSRYTFTIDKGRWLPVAVEEATPGGVLLRKVVYEKLRMNTGIGDSFFLLD